VEFGKGYWKTFEQGIEREWLLTNGTGGFASSTIIGANTRRYHGLLIASFNPPVQRHLILSKIDESISIEGREYNLYSFITPDYIMRGYHYLQRFALDPLPRYIFSVEDVFIEKKIALVQRENIVVIVYKVLNGISDIRLKLALLVNYRDYHQNSSRNHMAFTQKPFENSVVINPYNLELDINIYCDGGRFVKEDDCWFYNMYYPVEAERGLHAVEDHYIPGYFEVELKPGENRTISVIAAAGRQISDFDAEGLINSEEKRIQKIMDDSGFKDSFALQLVRASDDFIVYRKSTDAKTIIAGYPWFTDWGRDTMIALPGITLVTGRFEDARQILYTYSKYIKNGLVPNIFPDSGEKPYYNSVDAPLWYFEAVNKYIEYTGDYEFIKQNIYKVLKSIIHFYINGTEFNIKMDKDFLITAGNEKTQLTWMDAKVDDWVVTPRHGKAVEINALWYNALRIIARLAGRFGEDANEYENIAREVKTSFEGAFWNETGQFLYDVVNGEHKNDMLRPNQILAISLSYPVIGGDKAQKVVDRVRKDLYTAYGLRSLSPYSEKYRGTYAGDRYSRDGAYHQGTVWTWLLGHFITAYTRVYGHTREGRQMALRFIQPFRDHLRDACIGSISEIFDGDQPLRPKGAFAQAWSVGEILRAYVEDICGLDN
jgi:predicted glycogen debranching enzyme